MVDWRKYWAGRARAVLIAALVGLPVLGVSAKAAVIAYYAARSEQGAPAAMPAGYEAEDHFPGAALLYAAEDKMAGPGAIDPNAAPAAGTTGTADLPALPIPAQADLAPDTDGTVRPARPFSMAGASMIDRGRALQCLATAVYYEAASESDDGQRAVAQVILNRVRHPAFPNTVCGVVYQGSEHAGCQFSYACDGALARPPATGMTRATRIAAAALNGYVMGAVGLATHYHTYAVTPAWNRSLVMTDAIGAHFFHRWKGYWGTPAAFSNARYRGGEPVPGPHARIVPLPGIAPLPGAQYAMLGPVPAAAPPPQTALIQPGFQDASVAKAASASGDTLPGASQILDRWKDSGKPLR